MEKKFTQALQIQLRLHSWISPWLNPDFPCIPASLSSSSTSSPSSPSPRGWINTQDNDTAHPPSTTGGGNSEPTSFLGCKYSCLGVLKSFLLQRSPWNRLLKDLRDILSSWSCGSSALESRSTNSFSVLGFSTRSCSLRNFRSSLGEKINPGKFFPRGRAVSGQSQA